MLTYVVHKSFCMLLTNFLIFSNKPETLGIALILCSWPISDSLQNVLFDLEFSCLPRKSPLYFDVTFKS